MTRSPTDEPIMMIRPPLFMCFSAACVATKVPRNIDVNQPVQFLQRGLLEALGDGRAGIVHEHIKLAEGGDGLFPPRALVASAIGGVRLKSRSPFRRHVQSL